MAITIISPVNSFIRFGEASQPPLCMWGSIDFCLPVFEDSDIAFQWVASGTQEEVDAICAQPGTEVVVSIVDDCEGENLLTFTEKPQRFRLSDTQVLYNWPHGVTGFTTVVDINKCFRIRLAYGEVTYCSNCFERVKDACYTSVLEYGNDEDAFGFKYCYGGDITSPPAVDSCDPTIVTFVGVGTLQMPYTAGLRSQYGDVPTVQVWISNDLGQLVNTGITVVFDGYPVTMLNFDFGGISSGIIVIR